MVAELRPLLTSRTPPVIRRAALSGSHASRWVQYSSQGRRTGAAVISKWYRTEQSNLQRYNLFMVYILVMQLMRANRRCHRPYRAPFC
jgi:hypothetical protein